jgi:hypothetical protein
MKPFAVLAVALTCSLPAYLPAADDFVPMFNGRDFAGWTNVNCAPETWTMRNGMIISTGIPTGVLRTTRMYENFIVELEWRHMVAGGNAGFFIYSAPITAVGQPFTKGMEFQIIDRDHPQGIATRHGDVFAIHGATFVPDKPHPEGWMRSLPGEKRVKPQGEWNHYRIESRDGVVTLAVNGKVVSGGSNCVPRKGYICLESEGSECHFRNVRIREMPSSNPPAEHIAEEDQGWVSLYNGLDLRGWRAPGEPSGHWKAKDWILEHDGKGEGMAVLATERSFGNFELIVDWRLASRTNAPDVSGGSNGIHLPGGLVPFPRSKPAKPAGQWNRFRITTRGKGYVVRLNDEMMGEQQFAGPVKAPIGLRHRGAPIQFANIYVRELK